MKFISYFLRGTCAVPDGTTEIDGLPNHFRLPGGQIVSIQSVIEMSSDVDADDHRDLACAEAAGLDLYLECTECGSDLDDDPV